MKNALTLLGFDIGVYDTAVGMNTCVGEGWGAFALPLMQRV